MNKETFCSLPFTEIFLGPDGSVKTCCSADNPIGSLHKNTIDEIINGPYATEIRQEIINGNWHPNCRQCKHQESQNASSERKNDIITFWTEVGSIDSSFFKLKRLDLRWSNTCNLTCTYCYEYFSSKWATLKGLKINTIKDENENSLFLMIEKNIDSIENILMLGGEPLLQKQNLRLVNTITDNRSFYILTNLAIPLESNSIAQTLINERNAKWGVSFETVGKRYEYVRRGASWDVFVKNINYIQEKTSNNLDVHSLYSIYSAFNLVEFYEFIYEKNIKTVLWNFLESSGENSNASVFKLSPKLKQRAIEEIERCEQLFPDASGLDSLLEFKKNLKLHTVETNNSFVKEIGILENKYLKNETLKFSKLWPIEWALLSQ
jgi:sulfatase maturation enzyme AslB (radical SAM superfamily)